VITPDITDELEALRKRISELEKIQRQHQKTENTLKLSEQNFRNSLDSSLIGICISDNNNFTSYANQALLDIFGYENIDEVRSSPPPKHYTSESYSSYLLRHAKFLRGEPMPRTVDIDIVHKNGSIRQLAVFMKEVFWDGRQQYQTLYNDVTIIKQAEKTLVNSERNLQNALDRLPMGFRITDIDDNTLYLNQAFLDIFGYEDAEEVKIKPPLKDFYTPESYADYLVRKEKLIRGEPRQKIVEVTIIHKDGTLRHLQLSTGELMWNGKREFQTIYNDVTERKQFEKKLEQAAQEWKTTFDSITDMISIHDKDNRIVRTNKALADLLKTTPKELIGKSCHEVIHGTKEPPVNCPHLQTLKTGKSTITETFNPNLDIYLHESTSPLLNENGEVTGSVIVARDVTQQKRLEEQLMLTDRLASIGELSSGIAHELNNPLTSVIGFSQLLVQSDAPDNIKEHLSIIQNEAQRAAAIVKNLLTFARKHPSVKQLSQINSVLEEVLTLRAYEQKVNNIEIEKHLASDLPYIMIDAFQIQQVFMNIIVNAEFAMLEAHHKGKLTITTEKATGVIKITFTDDGPGITQGNLNRIFDPFFTTKEIGKGTGLGLSICHGIVTEHGGKIYARSEPPKGATFVVELPLSE
jgi:PAS domain S-box-containing protein